MMVVGNHFLVLDNHYIQLFKQDRCHIPPETRFDLVRGDLPTWAEYLSELLFEFLPQARLVVFSIDHRVAIHLFHAGFLRIEHFTASEYAGTQIRLNLELRHDQESGGSPFVILVRQMTDIKEEGAITVYLSDECDMDGFVERILNPGTRFLDKKS